jgi:hypothetical protein
MPSHEVHPTPDQIKSLRELIQASGVDEAQVIPTMRDFFGLADDFKSTLKNWTATLTMANYDRAWAHFQVALKQHVEEDVLDYSPPPGETTPADDSPTASDGDRETTDSADSETALPEDTSAREGLATATQIADLKSLAQQVGNDAYVDVQDMLEHYQQKGLPLEVYTVVETRLQARQAAKTREG